MVETSDIKSEEKAPISLEDARSILEKEIKNRVEQCSIEINSVLNRYNCKFEPMLIITPSGQQFELKIVPA